MSTKPLPILAVCQTDTSVKGTLHAIEYLNTLSASDLTILLNEPDSRDELRPNPDGFRNTERVIHRYNGHLAVVSKSNGFITHAAESILAGTYMGADEEGEEELVEVFWASRQQINLFSDDYPNITDWVKGSIRPEFCTPFNDETDLYTTDLLTIEVDLPSATIIKITVSKEAPKRDLTAFELREKIIHMLPSHHKGIMDLYDQAVSAVMDGF